MPADVSLRIFNTLTRRKEPFAPVEPGRAAVYTCGPTVYRYAHIGNMRSYLLADWLRRFLEAQGYAVTHVKNITDVGHMRQEMLDRGEDKVLAAARAEGKSPREIAAFYTNAFLSDEAKLNTLPATTFPRASENVAEMVELTRTLVEKGFAYVAEGNAYFSVSRFPGYGKLSGQQAAGLEEGARVEADPLKRDQRDFALWKAAEPGRTLKWPSPWGEGFPGWHIECSAMVAKFLGPEIDFHTGGVDNIFPHHEDEIAQSEAALGRRHVRYWLHGQHLLVDGLKMAKSTGNTYHIPDLERRGFDPLAFRYLCATAHYRARLNFTLPSLRAAQRGLNRLRLSLQQADGRVTKKAIAAGDGLRREFWRAAAADLNIPAALAVAWRAARSPLPGAVKRELLMDCDRLLGLDLLRTGQLDGLPAEVQEWRRERHALRAARDYARADALRTQLLGMGYEVRDTRAGTQVLRVPAWQQEEANISSSRDVASLLDEPAAVDFTISIVARQGCAEIERCLSSVRACTRGKRTEIIVVDNGFEEDCAAHLEDMAGDDEKMRVFHADHFLGSAAARNVSLRQARGRYVVFIDTSVELKGDIRPRLRELLDDPTVGMAGRWGVLTNDLRSFDEAPASGDVHAVEGYLMAFRREVLREVGFLDEKFRFYRHLDLDFSFAVRSRGYRAVIDTALPVVRHDHVDWLATPVEERDRLSKRNFYRFLQKWGERTDLVTARR
ncbi:MAG: cysteine--tRNA ligase [Dehalococcoidia bacterium]|nr:cysteine--tRNA ligase [Dehalococcoidia bacterium]